MQVNISNLEEEKEKQNENEDIEEENNKKSSNEDKSIEAKLEEENEKEKEKMSYIDDKSILDNNKDINSSEKKDILNEKINNSKITNEKDMEKESDNINNISKEITIENKKEEEEEKENNIIVNEKDKENNKNNTNEEENKKSIEEKRETNEEKENINNINEIKDNEEKNESNNNIIKLETYIGQNKGLESITNIPDLMENCNNYNKIILSHNKLTRINEFFIFQNVIYLDLSNNFFQKLETFYNLQNLETLLLNNNCIEHILMSLKNLSNLTHLDLSHNKIDMSDNVTIKALKYNPKLKKLLVKGNKNYNFQKIKYECLDSIKSLQYLDEEKIIRTVRRNRSLQKSYIKIKGMNGNSKQICGLKEYIQFKINDIKDNKDYENGNNDNNDFISRMRLDKRSKEKNSSNYYFTYLSSL